MTATDSHDRNQSNRDHDHLRRGCWHPFAHMPTTGRHIPVVEAIVDHRNRRWNVPTRYVRESMRAWTLGASFLSMCAGTVLIVTANEMRKCWVKVLSVRTPACLSVCLSHALSSQEPRLLPRDSAMRRVGWNLANCHATVQKLLVRQVLNHVSAVANWPVRQNRAVV